MKTKIKMLSVAAVIIVLASLTFVVVQSESVAPKNPQETLARVACLGDSITQDTGYPSDLQALLGTRSIVGSFGVAGATVNFNSDRPYFYEPEFRRARSFAPTTVVIMLGTNDAHNDSYQQIDSFVADYTRILNRIANYSSKPQIFVVIPPPVFFNTLGVNKDAYLAGVIPRVQQVAEQLHLQTINVYAPLLNHPEYFPDGLHPNSDGAAIIAQTVYKAIDPRQT